MKGELLGQSRPGDTNAVSVVSPDANEILNITNIFIANTTANTPTFRLFHDEDGTTYDQTTALYYDKATSANDTFHIETNIWMRDAGGNLAVRSSAASELTFTFYGTRQSK